MHGVDASIVHQAYIRVGLPRDALVQFELIKNWSSVIDCYRLLHQDEKAEALVRSQLEASPSPLLW